MVSRIMTYGSEPFFSSPFGEPCVRQKPFLACRRVTNLFIQVQFLQAIRSNIWYPRTSRPLCADKKGRYMIFGLLQRRFPRACRFACEPGSELSGARR